VSQFYEPAPGWDQPAAGRCRPGAIVNRDYILERWPADNLGCYVDRGITGGSSPSLHRDGRALDIGFIRDLDARDDCFNWLVANHDTLGVQMVLRYRSGDYGGDTALQGWGRLVRLGTGCTSSSRTPGPTTRPRSTNWLLRRSTICRRSNTSV